jgi:hypothetical protein
MVGFKYHIKPQTLFYLQSWARVVEIPFTRPQVEPKIIAWAPLNLRM